MDEFYNPKEPLVQHLRAIIRWAVRVLAVLMTAVIIWGVVDVCWVLYKKLTQPPFMMLTISDILATFGAFMAVLIAIEIFVNIIIYLRDDVIHVKIVLATALMAIARKVIILDFEVIAPEYVWATAGVTLAMAIAYWLVVSHGEPQTFSEGRLKWRSVLKNGRSVVEAETPGERTVAQGSVARGGEHE
ncbi:phosphate-starvation-inducible PsiE family protein [Geoalkalibacter sp.]|uniref:phosphate-starvation-inducible PsiE family protein n=1 Tax=Geoalkalibacter sp. TaxID=3041440 RepID=UPI00272E0B51|nr:phosphate-starvation-inducible PsiE family protein [Geoalkalibacter sp.]